MLIKFLFPNKLNDLLRKIVFRFTGVLLQYIISLVINFSENYWIEMLLD